jgi:alpha-beta hydrolase superfamily lysophospholipase
MANLDLRNVTVDLCEGCHGSSGFWRSWTDVRERIVEKVKEARTSKPSYKILVTGHSLGGAVATFAAVELRNRGFANVDLVSRAAKRIVVLEY